MSKDQFDPKYGVNGYKLLIYCHGSPILSRMFAMMKSGPLF